MTSETAVKRQKTSHNANAAKESSKPKKAKAPAAEKKTKPAADEDADEKPSEPAQPAAAEEPKKTFRDLGVMESLCQACEDVKYKNPTPIQVGAIPIALEGRDIIGVAQTGSGKTAAFALPILQALWEQQRGLFACVLAPTRELAYQISEQFEALGSTIGVRACTIVGGMNMMEQSVALGKKPHIVVATPGRLLDHLENTKGFSLRSIRYLVMDEADRLLEDMDFGPILDKILKVIPKERRTMLFSATMSAKVEKLQRASLSSPVRVDISQKYRTADNLLQTGYFIPFKDKDVYFIYLLNELAGKTILVFARTVVETNRLAILLRQLGFKATPLNGQMSQSSRMGALSKFKSGSRNIMIATDVAARGLDIPSVDCVMNFDLPQDSKTYVHRVGRTARAGRSGKSLSIITQYDVELWLRIETALGTKIDLTKPDKEEVMVFSDRVGEAQREAAKIMRDEAEKGRGTGRHGKKRGRDDNRDREEE